MLSRVETSQLLAVKETQTVSVWAMPWDIQSFGCSQRSFTLCMILAIVEAAAYHTCIAHMVYPLMLVMQMPTALLSPES